MNTHPHRWIWLALPCLALGVAAAADAPAAPPAARKSTPASAPLTDDQQTLYALGVLMSRSLENLQLSEAEFSVVRSGLADGYHKHPTIADPDSYTPKLQALARDRVAMLAQRERTAGLAYLDQVAKTPGATRTASGLLYVPVSEGTGAAPARTDRVKVNYEGRLVDGTLFDSSAAHGQPATFNIAGVIPCWSEALLLMKVGGKSRVVCPADLAYGDRGAGSKIRPGATLVFDIELLDILAPPAPPPPPIVPDATKP